MADYYPFLNSTQTALSRTQSALASSKLGILLGGMTIGSITFLFICLVSYQLIDQLHDGILQAKATLTTTVHRVATRAKNAPLTAEVNGSGITVVQAGAE